MNDSSTVSGYLIQQLYERGIRHIFGVPGDYVLGLFHELEKSPLEVINTCDEQGAGFAADAYARLNGLGAVCITYCVGGLKVANTTAQAYAEKSPVVVISGAPGTNERLKNPLLHHKVRDFDTQLKVFEQLTVASTVLNDPQIVCSEIDRVLNAAHRYKRPVYIEIPRDRVTVPLPQCNLHPEEPGTSDPHVLEEALREAGDMINRAKKPVIIAGIELARFRLQPLLVELIQATQIPVASTLLSKSVVCENHPRYMGVYEGAMGREEVTRYVESSDCLILLGTFMTDVNLGIFTAHLDQGRSIYATSEKIAIRYHTYESLCFEDFIRGLLKANLRRREAGDIPHPLKSVSPSPTAGKPVTVEYLFRRLNAFLDENTVVVADPGDAMFAAVDMTIHCGDRFMSPAYYTSLGFAVPASIGIQTARPDLRSLVLVGDGAFQMTGMELATIARFGLNPMILVLNNRGYGTERPMMDGRFNDVLLWDYSRIPEILKSGKGFDVKTEDELETALKAARENMESYTILDIHLDTKDISQALRRLTSTLGKRVTSETKK